VMEASFGLRMQGGKPILRILSREDTVAVS
jgi:hypothetical protein